MDHNRLNTVPDLRSIQNQPTSTADSPSDEPMAEADEPPDELMFGVPTSLEHPQPQHAHYAAEFKKMPYALMRKESLLSKTLHTSDESNDDEDEPLFSGSNRAHSSASTWSRGSRASTADLTSDGHISPIRSGSPSPQTASVATFTGKAPVFNQQLFDAPKATVKIAESIDPLKKPAATATSNEDAVEKGLGRKRCIMFACGGKKADAGETNKKEENARPKIEEKKVEEAPVARKCTLKFVCPSRADKTPTTTAGATKPSIRLMSPPPPTRREKLAASPRMLSPKLSRGHRSSDSTVRNESPKSVRKMPSVLKNRKSSNALEIPVSEATRFHEFASSEEELDDWTQEVTCHRGRLTIQDTLKVENNLRHVCEEADEEAMEEEEAEEQLEAMEDMDEDVDEDDEDADNHSLVDSTGYVTDEGFHTDDEEGFANSDDDDSDADSDYAWWAPAAASGEHLEHIRPSTRRSESGSSIGSFSSTRVFPSKTPKALKRSKTNPIEFRPRTPELPDSTDFVCGTLDEDRPLEEAWLSCRNQRRAANHRPCPQDIDPTFPASDPEMDEEDEEGYEDPIHMDDSDVHFFNDQRMSDIDESPRTGRPVIPRKRSPASSPRRHMRSPPPNKRAILHSPPPPSRGRLRSPPPPMATAKRAVHHSPPPPATAGAGKLFGRSPRRLHSPPPPRRPLRSPPPSRRTSFTQTPTAKITGIDINATPVALAQRPQFAREASSLPRNGPFPLHNRHAYFNSTNNSDDEDGEATQTESGLPTRGAIDIVKGLEKKRQRRKEKLYEKACRLKQQQGRLKREHAVLPGQGAEKMKKMGEGLRKARGGVVRKDGGNIFSGEETDLNGQHILSY